MISSVPASMLYRDEETCRATGDGEREKQISIDPISLAIAPKQKKKYGNHRERPLARQHSVALGNLERLRENHLRRSKSCGDGRASRPSVDIDLWGTSTGQKVNPSPRDESMYEEKFKCGACLFLPSLGLGKGKTVRARKEVGPGHIDIVSQRVSLEKFECGSWRSSSVEKDGDDATSGLFFDLPVELMRCSSVNDTESPVTARFVFDNKDHRKGALKTGGPCNSSRHVRFSTSPTLPKPTPHFTAFLEAHNI